MVVKMEEQFSAVPGEIDAALHKLEGMFSEVDSALSENVKLKMFGDNDAKTRLKDSLRNAIKESSSAFEFIKNKEFELKNYITTIKALHHSFEDKKKELQFIESEISKKTAGLNKLTGTFDEKKLELDIQLQEKESLLNNAKIELESINKELDEKQNQYLTLSAELDKAKYDSGDFLDKLAAKQKQLLDLDSAISEKRMKDENEKVVADALENKLFELKMQLTKAEEDLNKSRTSLKEVDTEVTEKRSLFQSIDGKITTNETALEQNKRELSLVEDELREKANKKIVLNEDIKKLETYKEYLDTDIKKLKPFLEKLEKAKEDFYSLSTEVVKLHNERVTLENNLPVIKQNSDLESIKLQDLTGKNNELESGLKLLVEQKNKTDEELNHSNQVIETNKTELINLNSRISTLELRISELEEIKNKYEASKKQIESKITEIRAKYERAVADLTNKETILIETTSIISEKQQAYNDLLMEYDNKRSQLKNLEKDIEKLQGDNKLLSEETSADDEKRKLLKSEIEKFELRKKEIEESLSPFEIKFAENEKMIAEQESKSHELTTQLNALREEFNNLRIEQDEKIAEFQAVKENYEKMAADMGAHQEELKNMETAKTEAGNRISSLQSQIDKMEEKKNFLETSLEPYQERIVFDGSQKASIDALKSKTDELLKWFEEFKSNLPKLKEASEKLPKTINQNFTDLREIFNKIKDFESKYKSFTQLKSELDSKAIKGDPKILDIFFKNRDLAMKEQDRIYNILNLFKQNDFEIKGLVDLYAMMMPDEVLNATSEAVNNNLQSLTTVIQKIDFESMVNEINNNVKALS